MEILTEIKSYFRNKWIDIKYFFKGFDYLGVYFSPFVKPKLSLYIGVIRFGTPYFYPRKWVKPSDKMAMEQALKHIKSLEGLNARMPDNPIKISSLEDIFQTKKKYKYPVPKNIGFDFVPLGWKTKWSNTDIRFEYAPLVSFVFFKWQIVLFFNVPEDSHYWEAWIFYSKYTDKKESVEDRLMEAMNEFPMIWITSKGDKQQKVNYWNDVLKKEYLKLVPELK